MNNEGEATKLMRTITTESVVPGFHPWDGTMLAAKTPFLRAFGSGLLIPALD
jgi:hypothetical protein